MLALDELVISEAERCSSQHPKIRFKLDLESSQAYGSESGLRRAIANMLDNAVKWSPPQGTITVSLTGGRLSVMDEGPGFAEEDLPRVFDRFYRSSAARTVPGSGLGLAIVQKVAAEHGGTAVAMNARGGGAVVAHRRLRNLTTPALIEPIRTTRSHSYRFPTMRLRDASAPVVK